MSRNAPPWGEPRPFLTSVYIDLATTSRVDSSILLGSYFSINLSPFEFLRIPPSPRTASVTRSPFTPGGQTIPVGWNCTNSISISSAPASYASACPSPVYSQEFDVILYALPIPPVARTTAFDLKIINLPVSLQYPKAPEIRSPSLRSLVMVHSI